MALPKRWNIGGCRAIWVGPRRENPKNRAKKIKISSKIIISFLAKTLKHRWLPSQMHQGKLHKSLKKSCIVWFFNAFFSVPFRAKFSENAETSVAVDPNASSQRRRKEQNHRFLTKNHQSAQIPVVKTQIASNTFFCLKLQRDLMEFDGIYNGNLGIYNGIWWNLQRGLDFRHICHFKWLGSHRCFSVLAKIRVLPSWSRRF